MQVYIVMGGCISDQHIIAVYDSITAAEKRKEQENNSCKGLEAYIEKWEVNTASNEIYDQNWKNARGIGGTRTIKNAKLI